MKYTLFEEIFKPISRRVIQGCVNIFNCDYDYEKLKLYEHLQAMVYAHFNHINSLRTLEAALNYHPPTKFLRIHRSTLSDANRKRSFECFSWVLKHILTLLPVRKKNEFSRIVRLLDSSPIQLKGHGYEWTHSTATRCCTGLKLHVEYDLGLNAPKHVELSHANFNDSSMGKSWPIQQGVVYIFDKGYCDYNWWHCIDQKNAFFVTRLKKNAAIEIKDTFKTEEGSSIIEDNLFIFTNLTPRAGKKNFYTIPARRICVKREGKHPLILVTNLLKESAQKIADLYKARWEIELFFKWIKQRLKIKRFLGKSENAVKIQLICAIITYVLVYLFQHAHHKATPLYLVLAGVSSCLTRTYNYKERRFKINDS